MIAPWEPVLAFGTAPEGTQLVHRSRIPARDARYAPFPADVAPAVADALLAAGIDRLYTHQAELWDAALAACPDTAYRPSCTLSLPALSNAFEIARLRAGAAEKHPPQAIYVMLFGLGLGGSLLAGFGMAAAKARSWIHMVIFAATLGTAGFPFPAEQPESDRIGRIIPAIKTKGSRRTETSSRHSGRET